MGRFEVQGIVSSKTGEPLVQFRQIDDEGEVEIGFQLPVMEAREISQTIVEAAANAVYEAAIFQWAKEHDPGKGEMMGIALVRGIREFRADKWGLPDQPEDWRNG